MTTITLSVPPDAKKYIKAKAAIEGISMRDLVLRSVGWKQVELTSNDFNAETRAAMEEDLSNKKQYTDTEEMFADILGKDWHNV